MASLTNPPNPPKPYQSTQPLCLVSSLVFLRWVLGLLLSSILAWFWIILVTLVVLGIEHKAGGLQEVEMWLDGKLSKTSPTSSPSESEDFEHVKPE